MQPKLKSNNVYEPLHNARLDDWLSSADQCNSKRPQGRLTFTLICCSMREPGKLKALETGWII